MKYQNDLDPRDLQDALTRAIESAEWAKQSDDVLALLHLRNFISSNHMRTMMTAHLSSYQPCLINLEHLSPAVISMLYAEAHQSDSATSITHAKYFGSTEAGSVMYELSRASALPLLLYIREHRGELRGELNEAQYAEMQKVPEVTLHIKPNIITFLKKAWSKI